jgi:hypothetical protein
MNLNLYGKLDYKINIYRRIKWWYRRWKFKWQRALWGFSAYDTWSMDSYLAELIGNMLLYKADHDVSYKYDVTPQEWQQKLKDIALLFKFYNEELPTPSYDKYKESMKTIIKDDGEFVADYDQEALLAWREEEKANHERKRVNLKKGFEELLEIYEDLWD